MKTSIHARASGVLIAIVLLPAAALTVFTPFYQTNDDIAMRLLAEGNFVPGDKPLPYLMFINVIVGKMLSLAYGITTAIPWYDVVLGASMIAASAALVYVWSGSGSAFEVLGALLLASYFLFPMFVSVQFSLAGLACAAAGIGLIVRAALTELAPRARRLHLLLGAGLFVWGSLIRFEGALLIAIEGIALALPFLPGLVRNREDRPRLRPAMVAASAALLLIGVGFVTNQLAYRHARGWQTFYEYNLLRSRLGEYIAPERLTPDATLKLAKEVGWSENDFALFQNWFFTDPNLFSLAKVKQAERLFYGAAAPRVEDWRTLRAQRGIELGKAFFAEARWAFLLMGVFVLAQGMRPKLVLYFAATVVTLGVLIVGISLALKAPPQRIFWPMLILAATMLSLAAQRWGGPMHWSVNVASLALATYIVVMAIPPLMRESEARKASAAIAQEDADGLRRTGATMFILHANAFPYEDFWRPLHTEKASFDFVGLGASARTPPVQDYLMSTGHADLPWSLCTSPTMLIVARQDLPPRLARFVEEHRGVKVELEPAFEGKRIQAWKCRRLPFS